MMILPVGLPGSGKTTVERKFAREQNALCLTPDERIIPLFGEPEADGKRPSIGNRQLRQRWLSACRYVSAEDPNGLRDFSPNEGSECEIPAEGLASVELRTTRLRLRDFELGGYQAVHAFATDLAVVSYVEGARTLRRRLKRFCARREQVPTFPRVGGMRLPWSTPMRKG
jgi:hypothetical protein